MMQIDHFNLRSFDLNLLLAFDALMEERGVTKAAVRLRIQQPAMSHALSTLRLLFQDDLFVRVGPLMVPTPRAQALAGPVRDLLAQAQSVLLSRDAFDPGREKRTFRIGASATLEVLFLPRLIAYSCLHAPGISLLGRETNRLRVFDMFDEGAIDVAVGYFPGGSSWHKRETLFYEKHLCCFNPKLLELETPIELPTYLKIPHALISARDSLFGYMKDAYSRAGILPNMVLAAPNFLSLITAAVQAPILITLPAGVARQYASQFGLQISPLPFEIEDFPVDMLWHARSDGDPATDWLRTRIRASSKL